MITSPKSSPIDSSFLKDLITGQVRLTTEQALYLWHETPLNELGRIANERCSHIHGDSIRTYVIDRNINYTNVCTAKCIFCAFRRDLGANDAYTLSTDEIEHKIKELIEIGGTQILMQGGMNPELPIEWYEELLQTLKSKFPKIHIHAFSPPEIIEFINFFKVSGKNTLEKSKRVLKKLQDAGLDSLPGGGGEIFAPAVRQKLALGKCTGEAWLDVMQAAQELGMHTSGTMMFGHIEGINDRIYHLDCLRKRQDFAIDNFSTNGGGRYHAFISWPFQRENTPLGRLPDWKPSSGEHFPGDLVAKLDGSGDKKNHKRFGRVIRTSGSTDYLRTQAISRLFLDNFYSIGSSWVTMGPHIGQIALSYGANDMGSVMMEENVVSSAGATWCLNEPILCRLIREAGFYPAQRDNNYEILKVHDTNSSPDKIIKDWSTTKTNSKSQNSDSVNITLEGAST